MRQLQFTPSAWDDYLYWLKHDKATVKRINTLIKDATKNPHTGVGKPERLKYELQSYWSRRINQEHRFVYGITDQHVVIISLRYHYQK
jgi:toxin YoeB